MIETIQAKALWGGSRFSLVDGGPVYVIKTYQTSASSALTLRAERRLTSMTRGFFGWGKRWKTWSELGTPIEEQDPAQEVIKQ